MVEHDTCYMKKQLNQAKILTYIRHPNQINDQNRLTHLFQHNEIPKSKYQIVTVRYFSVIFAIDINFCLTT